MATPSSTSPPTFDITPPALLQSAEDVVKQIQTDISHLLVSIPIDQATFDNAIRPLAQIDNDVKSSVQYIALFQAVSPSSDLRKASSSAVSIIDKAYLAIFQHECLFALVDEVHSNPSRGENDTLDEEDRRLLDRFHRMFVDNGIKLVGPSRERYTWVSRRLVDLRVAFMENLSRDPGYMIKLEFELEGVSLDTLERRQRDPHTFFRIPLTRPGVDLVLANCRNADTRAEFFLQGQRLYQEKNVPIFREIVVLRDEAARLLGFDSFASQKLRQQLVKSLDRVGSLLDELTLALQPLAQQELQVLQKGVESTLRLSDFDYYHNKMLREKYHIDQELVAEYFPAQVTVRRILDIFETLFALAIKELDGLLENCKWHPDVTVYKVWEADESVFIGYLYVDIYPRQGKFNHAANFNIYPSYIGKDGNRTSVASALVCNVSNTSDGQPALLRHREVMTKNAGNNTSQPSKEIPDELVHNLVAAKQVNQGILTLRQVAFSKFDMRIHNPVSHDEIEETDISELYNSLLQDMTGLQWPDQDSKPGSGYATTSHYVWGQEANYYSYLYTRILVADIWHPHFQSAPLSRDAGLRYRNMILSHGGSRDEWELLTKFLGRDPNIHAYLRDIAATSREDGDDLEKP